MIVTEGEKAADAATLLFPKCVATTSPNGAKAPDQSDWTPLSGRTVWIWHDHDEPGREYAASVAKLLKGIAAEVKILRIDGQHAEGWDAADALVEGRRPLMHKFCEQPCGKLVRKVLRGSNYGPPDYFGYLLITS